MDYKDYDMHNPNDQKTNANANTNNILKKVLLILGILLAIYLISTIFTGINANKEQSVKPPLQEWTVTKSTYIYHSPSFDSDTKGELAVGDIVTLPIGVTSPECKTISEPGLSATLCYLRAKRSGIEGWVLKKWIE
jgi:hypothetical protein